MPLVVMSAEERQRRKELRRRPKMMAWARELGLLLVESEWTVVTARKKGCVKKWGDGP